MTAAELAQNSYINLETFKRDGSGAKTPVWCAPLGNQMVIFSEGDAFKVKRLRRNPEVRVAACDVVGKPRGDWYSGRGEIMESKELEDRAYVALRKKYGWQMRTLDFFSGLAGKINTRAVLKITLND
jgi:PPOX class probable F420-dependent enzyme